ncbi:hypothetical protein EKO04_003935 [Ascochyta lentis]|uniref:Pisatin demethylase n=1 Tax=Ascochyta lentis TaxID=205686 RepID=A0A8H7MEX9_9PLEO|nr:hypothetical protein EKO04_003935 [Ascochyta lentis]
MAPPVHALESVDESSHGRYYIYGIVALLGLGVFRYVYQTLTSPLRGIPGPFLARFTRLWELQAVRTHDNPTFNIALHEKYGPIVRLAPNRYSLNDAEAAKVILGHHNALDKSKFYHPFGLPDEYNIFSEPSISTHAKSKRPVAQLYSQTSLLSYEPFVDTCNTILLKRLEEYAQEGKTLDVREMMQYYAFDVIGEITVGSRFGLMEDDGDKSGIIKAIDEAITYSAFVGLIPEWHWWWCAAMNMIGVVPSVTKVIGFVNHHIDNRVSGRSKSPSDRRDFLDKMLPLEQQGKATRFHTRQAAQQNIGAGSDTTAISITAVIAFLTMHPDTLVKLRHELDEATKSGTLSDPVKFQEAQKLPYLQAVILEALRIHPAVGAPMVRVVGPQGAQLAGQFFPPGTEVGINAWVTHRNKSIFGSDADVFRPERWLTDNKEERSVLDRNFLAFGSGPRTCIGKNISLLEMSKVIPQVVMKYNFEIVKNEYGNRFSWKTRWFSKPDFNAVVRRRTV